MERNMEQFLFTAAFLGAAMCVGFAYEVGRSGVHGAREKAFQAGKHCGQAEAVYKASGDSGPSAAVTEDSPAPGDGGE